MEATLQAVDDEYGLIRSMRSSERFDLLAFAFEILCFRAEAAPIFAVGRSADDLDATALHVERTFLNVGLGQHRKTWVAAPSTAMTLW
ncbi:hypothetical protein [Acidisphaera sp. S103]|uniref:hypothetical protein n=1 Tax=Acidisphaera sp. S103 TaxID=1747223 RepID=UPI00131C707C|nr:hypothetical protein [Acidisphaera sp. S103]